MSTTSAEAGKVAKALRVVLGNTELSADDGIRSYSFDSPTVLDGTSLNGYDTMFNNQGKDRDPYATRD
jgi:hypothetical protein